MQEHPRLTYIVVYHRRTAGNEVLVEHRLKLWPGELAAFVVCRSGWSPAANYVSKSIYDVVPFTHGSNAPAWNSGM